MSRSHRVKRVHIQSFSGPYFPAFRLNTYIYKVNLRIQSECGKMRTRKAQNTDTFHVVSFFQKALVVWIVFSKLVLLQLEILYMTWTLILETNHCKDSLHFKDCKDSLNLYMGCLLIELLLNSRKFLEKRQSGVPFFVFCVS